ncbi:rho guanyl nucleotide exchange factor [Stemphylium lycopersici]|nr:rho guanyl nucleotide exchange factor [Stemphylium lycopersici]RAR00366.1 rho guanyl nucleotide exchange factor [Stemphylium lycopersici]
MDPEQAHEYAYNPGVSVSTWLQSTELDHADEALGASPEHYYSAYTTAAHAHAHAHAHAPELEAPASPQHGVDMAATRPRQPVTNGSRTTPKATPRSASGPASSSGATRSPPPTSTKVRALAERFERSPGASSPTSSPVVRSRSREPSRGAAHDVHRRANASVSSTASAARPSKEASYGPHKFSNLKPRDRPQPAPSTPRHTRRAHGGSRSSLDQHMSPGRSKVASPTRASASSARQLFGEVLTGQDVLSPGFGIPTAESTLGESPLPATAFHHPHHGRSGSAATSTFTDDAPPAQSPHEQARPRSPQRHTPRSRIPVARRRLSAGSDSNSSTRSVKYTPTRAMHHSRRASPTGMDRALAGAGAPPVSRGADQSTLPALAYRGYRERGKSPLGSRPGPSVAAVVTAPPPPTSPRLRNSRERQPLQPSPASRSRSADPHDEHGYFPIASSFDLQQGQSEGLPGAAELEQSFEALTQAKRPSHDQDAHPSDQHYLSLQTSNLSVPSPGQPQSAMTDFDESPVLGIPGSFVLTPPTAKQEQEQEQQLLQPSVFHAPSQTPDIEQSELGVRESIPIMLSDEQSTQPWEPDTGSFNEGLKALSYDYQSDRVYDAREGPPTPRYEASDSLTASHPQRDTLYPDDSASVAPHRKRVSLTPNTETYSVVNSVLNMYHQSPVISPELATVSRERVQQVSPVIAQHKDWASKEATETYLARLLSDANGSKRDDNAHDFNNTTSPPRPSREPPQIPRQSPDAGMGGTVLVYPSSPRRYSGESGGSTTTTIQEDASHSGSSSGNHSRDGLSRRPSNEHPSAPANAIELPQLAWANGGLGLDLHHSMPHSPLLPNAPPRPNYSPPPPPVQPSIDGQVAGHNAPYTSLPHHQLPRSTLGDEQFEMHPARSRTPVIHIHEKSLEDRYGTPQPVEMIVQAPTEGEKGENGQPDPVKQALIKRYRTLEELLTTEHQFCIDMMIAHNIFEATAQNLMSEKEKRLLFSNCKELEKFSLSLFRAFKKAAKPVVNYEIPPPTGPWNRDSSDSKSDPLESSLHLRRPSEDAPNQFENCTLENDRLTTIGQVFLDNKEKMERLYTTYFLNQDNASAYIKKNHGNETLSGWAWDLDSLLLKPCQRLLKYPLILQSLQETTDPDHPDLPKIREANEELRAMSQRINQAKARSDTFRAAASEGKKEKKSGLGKTFVKAFIPKVDKSKAYDEADKTFKDQDYKSKEQKFGGHFFQLQIVIRDFEQYLEAITEHYLQLNIVFLGFITVCEVAPSVYPEIESTWRKWAMAHFELQNKALEEHKAAVRSRVLKPVGDLWEMWVSYQKTIEQRKKYLLYYVKHKQTLDRGERVDPDVEESANKFSTINDTLKHELPLLYERTKGLMRTLMTLFMCLQKDWYKTCSKKILPLLESEPQHTTSLRYDLESYVERFHSDYKPMQDLANKLGIVNRNLLIDISNMTSPVPTVSSDGGGSSRNSSSRRTESMGSEASMMDSRNRNSGGYAPRSHPRGMENPPRSSPAGPAYPSLYPPNTAGRAGPGPTSLREARALSPVSDNSDATIMHGERRNTGSSRSNHNYMGLDGAVDTEHSPSLSNAFDFPPQLGPSFLSPSQTLTHTISAPTSQPASLPGSSRGSGVFNSALPMSDSPVRGSVEELPTTPAESDEPEVLFLAASLFEFNIAHDRREGGIPYLVYVPGEIFDVIGMKGELWLARNQDDATKTVGWIWEKHFARILPEDA